MTNQFENREVLSNRDWNKTLGCIDSFYINSALVSVYDKEGSEFIDISESQRKMYEDIYNERIKTPEVVDDSWVNVTLARYVENDIKQFEETRSKQGDISNLDIVKEVLSCFSSAKVQVCYSGLNVNLNLSSEKDLYFKTAIVTSTRGKLASKINLEGKEIKISAVTASAKNLQRFEVLELKIFIDVCFDDKQLKIILSKRGDSFSGIFVDDGLNSCKYEFKDFDIDFGSFDINRGV